jgi:hypothetical protein
MNPALTLILEDCTQYVVVLERNHRAGMKFGRVPKGFEMLALITVNICKLWRV